MKHKIRIIFICVFIIFTESLILALDNDYDGLDDTLEQQLLDKYAPQLCFHPDEKYYNYDVNEWFANYDIDLIGIDVAGDPYELDSNVSPEDIMVYADPTITIGMTTYVEHFLYPNGAKPSGSPSSPSSIYGHVFKSEMLFSGERREIIEVQYWIWYSFNEAYKDMDWFIGNHYGDWEYISIALDYETKEPIETYYSAHYADKYIKEWDGTLISRFNTWGDISKVNGTHPKVYVAKGTHANFYTPGSKRAEIEIIFQDYKDEVSQWGEQYIPAVINMGEIEGYYNTENCKWLLYAGRWGGSSYEVTGPPFGPAHGSRNSWHFVFGVWSEELWEELYGNKYGGVDFKSARLTFIEGNPDTGEIEFIFKAEEAGAEDTPIDFEETKSKITKAFLAALAIPNHKQYVGLPVMWNNETQSYEGYPNYDEPFQETDLCRFMFAADAKMKFSNVDDSIDLELDMNDEWQDLIRASPYWPQMQAQGFNEFVIQRIRYEMIPSYVNAYSTGNKIFVTDSELTTENSILSADVDLDGYSFSQEIIDDINDRLETWKETYLNELNNIIVPAYTESINNSDILQYVDIREVFPAVACAQWYKTRCCDLPYSDLIDSENLEGFGTEIPFEDEYWGGEAYQHIVSFDITDFYGNTWIEQFWGGCRMGLAGASINVIGDITSEQEDLIAKVKQQGFVKQGNIYYILGDRISIPTIDLVCYEVHLDSNPAINGDPVEIEFSIANTGSLDAGSFKVRVYDILIQEDGTEVANLIQEINIPGLSGNSAQTFQVTWNVGIFSGNHKIRVAVDPAYEVNESNGNNNILDLPIIDETLPITELTVDSFIDIKGNNIYVSGDVIITLTAGDPGPIPSGIQYTKYRTNEGEWQNYENPFMLNIDKDHIYKVEYYSVDLADNVERVNAKNIIYKNSYCPAIVCSENDIYIVFEDTRNGNSDIYFRESGQGGNINTWSADENISGSYMVNQYPGAEVNCYKPDIAVDSSDNIYVVWHYAIDNVSGICFAKKSPVDIEWSYYILPLAGISDLLCYSPKIACYDEYVHIAWSLFNNETEKYELYYTRRSGYGENLDLEQPLPLVDDGHERIASDITVDRDGNISILYEKIGGNEIKIKQVGYFYSEDNGGTWNERPKGVYETFARSFTWLGSGTGTWPPSGEENIELPEGYVIYDVDKDISLTPPGYLIDDGSYYENNIYHIELPYRSKSLIQIGWKEITRNIWADPPGIWVTITYEVPVYGWVDADTICSANYMIKAQKYDLESENFNDAFQPKLSIDNDNDVSIVWTDNKDGNAEIYSKPFTSEENAWKEKQRLTDDVALSMAASIDAGSKGFNIAWQEERDSNKEIYFKNSPDKGLTWSEGRNITENGSSSMVPVIGENNAGQNVITWQDNESGRYDILTTIDEGKDIYEPTSSLAGLFYDPVILDPENPADAYFLSQGELIVGIAYDIKHVSEAVVFDEPFVLKFYYTDADIPGGISENDLNIYWFDGEAWVRAVVDPALIERDTVNNSVAITVDHISKFAMLSPYDIVPPATEIMCSQPVSFQSNIVFINNTTYITLASVDSGENVSGIWYTEYRTNSSEWTKYAQPLRFDYDRSKYYSLEYRSVDKVGNKEDKNFQILGLDVDATKSTVLWEGIMTAYNYIASITNRYSVASIDVMSGVKEIMFNIDNSGYKTYTNEFYFAVGGWHTIKYRAVDNVDNWEDEKVFNVFADTFNPEINIMGISEGEYYNHDVQAEIEVTDDSPFMHTNFLNGEGYSSGTLISDENEHTLFTFAIDIFGNQTSATVNFTIDKTPPFITVTGVTDKGAYNYNVTPVIEIEELYLKTNIITLNGEPFTSGTVVSNDGEYQLYVYAEDLAGNFSSVEIDFVIDQTPPDVPEALTGYVENISNIALFWDKVTNGDSTGYNVYGNGIKINDTLITNENYYIEDADFGEHSYQVSSVDWLGNESDLSAPYILTIDTSIVLMNPEPGIYFRDMILIKIFKDKKQEGPASDKFAGLIIEYGEGENPETWNLIDEIDPLPRGRQNINCPWKLRERINNKWVDLNGEFRLRIRLIGDGEERQSSIIVWIDNTAPQTTISDIIEAEDGQLCLNTGELIFNPVDPEVNGIASGIRYTKYYISENAVPPDDSWTIWDGIPITLEPGAYNVWDYSEDNARKGVGNDEPEGNIEKINYIYLIVPEEQVEEVPQTLVIETVEDTVSNNLEEDNSCDNDITPPDITIAGVENNMYYNHNLNVNVSVQDDNLINYYVELKQKNDLISSHTGKVNTTVVLPEITVEGDYNLAIQADDCAGNTANTGIAFSIDKTAPIVEITGVVDQGVYSNEVQPGIDVIEEHPQLIWTNLQWSEMTNEAWQILGWWNGGVLTNEGQYIIDAGCEDKAGNITREKAGFELKEVSTGSVLASGAENNTNINDDHLKRGKKAGKGTETTEDGTLNEDEVLESFMDEIVRG